MTIPYNGQFVMLFGDMPDLPMGSVVQLSLLHDRSEASSSKALELPQELSDLLTKFAPLFEPPTELPPWRDCDHSIPFIEGMQPVFIRPYRYAPILKSEIER